MRARDVLCLAIGAFVACGLVYIAADPVATVIGVLGIAGGIVVFSILGWTAGAGL
jgi:hypothetical protein